jgi:DNA-binding response OmpR family regulator
VLSSFALRRCSDVIGRKLAGRRERATQDGSGRMRVLVVEDNRNLVANLFEYFEARGYALDAAPDGPTGLHLALNHDYDAIVLDWMLPRMDGREVLARLRAAGRSVPVLMLTARAELDDKVGTFRSGADDYLTKPFDLPELEVRLEALAMRTQGRGRRVLEVADLRLDLATLEVTRGGRSLHLYPACRKLLEMLMQASPAAVPRERLERGLWGDSPPDGDMLRSHVYELRRSVDGPFATKLIHTLPRVGYRIALPEGTESTESSDEV